MRCLSLFSDTAASMIGDQQTRAFAIFDHFAPSFTSVNCKIGSVSSQLSFSNIISSSLPLSDKHENTDRCVCVHMCIYKDIFTWQYYEYLLKSKVSSNESKLNVSGKHRRFPSLSIEQSVWLPYSLYRISHAPVLTQGYIFY